MLNKAPVADGDIESRLREGYGIDVSMLTFLPLGNDTNSWSYRAETSDGDQYFLKLKRGAPYPPSLSVPRFLRGAGVEAVVAPVPALTGDLWAPVGGFSVLVYPFVEAETGMTVGLSEAHWTEVGRTLRAVHATTLPPEISASVAVDRFNEAPWWQDTIANLLAGRYEVRRDDGPSRDLLGAIAERREAIAAVSAKAETTRLRLATAPPPAVLCHCDVHTNNILVRSDGRIFVVDWDQPVIAPRERDLMFVLGAATGDAHRHPPGDAAFLRGYGDVEIDPVGMAYYRSARALSDIVELAIRVLGEHDVGMESRRAAADGINALFRPQKMVSAALASPIPD